MITLTKTCTAFGEIEILHSRVKGSHIYCQEDWFQSEADRNGVSLAGYVHAIFGLLIQTTAREVLMIGCGGGTLATMLSRAGRLATVVDINPHSIALAQQYFSLPGDVTCYVEDGSSFLKRHAKPFDAIVIDAFLGDRVPPHLSSLEFFQLVRQRLAPSGCVFFNVFLHHGSDPSADGIAGSMAEAEFVVRVLEPPAPLERNAIVMGGAVAGLRPPTLLVTPAVLQDEITAELELMQFRSVQRSCNPIAGSESAANFLESQTP
jgi:2-polyprenyl-3-methyl-5-hydroxy-6-metoxy-1,4-benzoquinol methylase